MREYEYRKEIVELRSRVSELEKENERVTKNLESVLQSKSWKATKTLRKISSMFQKEEPKQEGKPEKKETFYDYHEVPAYTSRYEEDIDFNGLKPLVKTIAFYLPQFHQIKENDEWWGEGFTEWTNTKKACPRFDGHYMPREPHEDLGYYNLDNIETLKWQVDLAKRHGLYGFSFYYYWFSGKRLLEKPVDLLLSHKEINFPFCLCWANENWTRSWDGLEKEILIEQKYGKEDPINFIKDIKKYVEDERYIRVEGHPLILVYNPSAIPSFKEVCELWRETARKIGIGEIVIWSKTEIARNDYANTSFVDGEFDFAPHGFHLPNDFVTGLENTSQVVNYAKLIENLWETYENHYPLKPFSYSVTMGWDNSARRQNGYKIYYHYTLESFYLWTTLAMKKLKRNEFQNTFLFVNAWNEWGEGTYLEPDKKYGYANINTLSKAIHGLPLNGSFKILNETEKLKDNNHSLAIQCHIFYVDLLNDILEELKKIPIPFDLYLSTTTEEKKKEMTKIVNQYAFPNVEILVMENKGRDIRPMLIQMKDKIKNYDYFLHLHTKKSKTNSYGEDWREYLFHHLLGSKENIIQILNELEKKEIGLVYPKCFEEVFYLLVNPNGCIGGNKEQLEMLFEELGIPKEKIVKNFSFPVGSMFWAKVDAIKELFEKFKDENFTEEKGELDRTYAHAIERVFTFLAEINGYQSEIIYNRREK